MSPAPRPLLRGYRLVLVAPRVPGNVGACARIASNFECDDWVIVDPQCSWDDWDAKKIATGIARERLERIRVVPTVSEAVQDCHAAVGFTRRNGKIRKTTLALAGIPSLAMPQGPGKRQEDSRVALVFGNEETGLTAEELIPCTHVCTLPTSDSMPSMNLSHAVGVALARVFEIEEANEHPRSSPPSPSPSSSSPLATPAQLAELNGLMEHWRELLVDIGMTVGGNPDRMVLTLRRLLGRARPTPREVRALRGVISKAQVALGTRKRGRRV